MELIIKLAAKMMIAASRGDIEKCKSISAKIAKVMSTYDRGVLNVRSNRKSGIGDSKWYK